MYTSEYLLINYRIPWQWLFISIMSTPTSAPPLDRLRPDINEGHFPIPIRALLTFSSPAYSERNHPIGQPFQLSINSNPSIQTISSFLSHACFNTVSRYIPNTKHQNGLVICIPALSLPLSPPRAPTSTRSRLTALPSALSPSRYIHFRSKGCDISRRPSPRRCPSYRIPPISAHVRHLARAVQPWYGYGRGGACSFDCAKSWHGSSGRVQIKGRHANWK